jgi:very-short-patch-repair endonuclease
MRRRATTNGMDTAAPYGAQPEKVRRARMFRQAPTSAEALLWEGLRRRSAAGLRFRRQHVIAGYIVDFYCPSLRLAIEVDGSVHEARREHDEQRTRNLAQLGVTVLRIPNARVQADLVSVIEHILEVCESLRANHGVNSEPS